MCFNIMLPIFKKNLDLNIFLMFQKEKSSRTLALQHFDTFYKPIYGAQWPGIRSALLTTPKCSALVNNFYLPDDKDKANDLMVDIISSGADNIFDLVQNTEIRQEELKNQKQLQDVIMSTTQLQNDSAMGEYNMTQR